MNKKITLDSFLLLRIGLGFVFFWFGLDKLIHPGNWVVYITPFLSSIIFFDITLFLFMLGTIEIIFGILLWAGWKLRIVSLLISIHLFLIIIFTGFNEITIRDIGLLSIALALFIQNRKPS